MSSGPRPPKKPRTTLQQVGRVVKGAFHKPSSQSLPPNPAGPSSQPTQNQPSGSTAQPAQTQGATGPTQSSTAAPRGVKRAARAAWSMLGNALRTLEQSSDMFPPVKPAINGLLAGIDFLEEASQGREEYDELASDLAVVLTDLAKHLQESRSIQMSNCASNIISGIEEQIDAINLKKDRRGLDRFLNTREDLDDLIECYRRIETLFRQLQSNAILSIWSITHEHLANTRLESMQPAKNAHYDSAMAAVVRRRQCTLNTRQAVLQDLRAWKDDSNGAKVYWMNGMAGTGKTTIASTLCSELEAGHQLAASFFCSRELPDCRDATRIIPTISYQLARFSLPFQSALCETLANDPDASTRSVEVQFKKLVKEPLVRVNKAVPEGVIVVIDALDECVDNANVQSFLDALCASVANLPIKLFITCRPDQGLLSGLRSWNHASRELFHLHDIEQSVVQGDIEMFLRDELKGLPVDQIRQLAERSGKLFIFAATVVRYVKPSKASTIQNERLKTILDARWSSGNKAYASLDNLYGTILSAALSHDELEPAEVEKIKRVLHTVICLKEPMTIRATASLLGIISDEVEWAVEPLLSVLHITEGTGLISTLHASFPDYMLNQERSKQFFCDTSAHNHLALRCFNVMKKSLRFNICNLESSYVLDADVPDLAVRVDNTVSSHLFYACSHWADHLCEAGTEGGLVAPLDDFLSNNLLFWLEVLSLKKCVGIGVTMLATLQKWSQEHNAPSAVYKIAQDAYKFTTLVGTCQSTPHIYMSVLALWNRENPMWASYGTRIRGLVQPGGALQLKAASALLATWNNGDSVSSIAVSLDGARIVSNYKTQFIVWDAYTGNQILSPTTGHTCSTARCVAISPNGRSIASGSGDGTVYIWDAETANIIAGPLEGHTKSIRSVVFSPDSSRLVSSSNDRTIRIWDSQTGRMLLGPLEGHTDNINSVVFSPDGGRIASGSDDGTIRIWNAQTGHILMGPLQGHTRGVYSVGFSPNGARVTSSSWDCTIRVWDAHNGGMLAGPFREQFPVLSVAFSLDGNRIVSGSLDGIISVWCAHSGSALASFGAATDAISSVAFSPDGNRLISGSDDRTIRIWDMNTSSLGANQLDSKSSSVLSHVFSPDSSCIALMFDSGAVRVWDMHTGSSLGDLSVSGAHAVALSPKGARLALGLGNNIELWDVGNRNRSLGPLRGHTEGVRSLAFSPDGKRLASGSDDGTIHLWDVQTGSILSCPLKGHASSVDSVTFSPDGARIASGSWDCTVCIWDGQSGDMIFGPLRGHSWSVGSVRFSPDGRLVVSQDDAICVWDAQTGNMLANRSAEGYPIAFPPDGSCIVSGSWSGAIQIQDAQTQQTLAGPFEAHPADVDFVAFSPDGSGVVSGSQDGRILIWELRESDYDVSNVASAWTIQNDGWIIGRNSARLLWLPPALRTLPQEKPIVAHNRGPFGVETDWARWAACFSET